MKTMGLPGRIACSIATFVLVGGAAFHICMHWLPEYAVNHSAFDVGSEGYGIFKAAIGIALWIALTVSLPLLTLPGLRRRKRKGRSVRIAITCGLVVGGSLLFAEEGFRLRYDLLFLAWLTYLIAFTFVRYGVTDDVRRSSAPAKEY